MKCYKCNKKSTVQIPHLKPLCNNCFTRIIEKRIRKYIRINKLIRKNDRLIIRDTICLYFIKKIIKSPIKIVKKNGKNVKEILPYTLDDECNLFLYLFFNKNYDNNKLKNNKKNIKLFKTVTEQELIEFSKIKHIKYKPLNKHKNIENLLNNLNKKYPEIKFSLLKCINNIKEIED